MALSSVGGQRCLKRNACILCLGVVQGEKSKGNSNQESVSRNGALIKKCLPKRDQTTLMRISSFPKTLANEYCIGCGVITSPVATSSGMTCLMFSNLQRILARYPPY